MYRLGRTCLQREHAVSVCATRDELSSAALSLSLALPLAGPPAAGACIPPILVQQGDGGFSHKGTIAWGVRLMPQLTPPACTGRVSHKADSLFVL